MKKAFIYFALLFCIAASGQTGILEKYQYADSLFKASNYEAAYNIFKEIEPKTNPEDTIYNYILWYYTMSTTQLESLNRMAEQWSNSLKYGLEALRLIKKGKSFFDENFTTREYWMHKNLIVSYFALGQMNEVEKHKKILYTAYNEKKLPEGLDGYFNFSFFKWRDKNIWGYEWYPELPEDRFSTSFTKVVYYVYSTNPDGSDKGQLFRFHVLMFHQDSKDAKFDYLLERQMETDKETISGSYYRYTYKKEIDFLKLKKDIIEILEKDIQPDSRRSIPKR